MLKARVTRTTEITRETNPTSRTTHRLNAKNILYPPYSIVHTSFVTPVLQHQQKREVA